MRPKSLSTQRQRRGWWFSEAWSTRKKGMGGGNKNLIEMMVFKLGFKKDSLNGTLRKGHF